MSCIIYVNSKQLINTRQFSSSSFVIFFIKMPRHNDYSFVEMRNMVCVYAQENYCGRHAAARYLELYPNNRQPNHKLFKTLYDRLGETGSFRPKRDVGRPKVLAAEQEEDVLVRIAENTQTSTRRISSATGVSQPSVFRILHKEKLYPYHFRPVQQLMPQDPPGRFRFAQFLRRQQNADPTFYNKILFTDEATFTRRGVFNWRNSHSWELENPHLPREQHFQHEFSINIWCGILSDNILGPFVLPRPLNGENYLNFLTNDLPLVLENIPLNLRQTFWFMHDGAPAHYSRPVREYLDISFRNRWIGRGSEVPWPARSPDLNPLDFYFWGNVKSLVYKDVIHTREELWAKIQESVNIIRDQQRSLFSVRQNFNERIKKCIENNGRHFENLL
uniref:Transposable element Tc3 transposase n=3 Tax=Anoplophora glabripennis TaxID=217634 RepID=V5GHS2_ANOGL